MAEQQNDITPEQPAEQPAEQPKAQARIPEGKDYVWGTGRRKKSVARVRIRPGTGKILINKREFEEYFTESKDRNDVQSPLNVAQMRTGWDVWVNVNGGGYRGQSGAVSLGLARALARAMPEVERALRDQGLMTRDARMKERKKYGLRGARRSYQFSKR